MPPYRLPLLIALVLAGAGAPRAAAQDPSPKREMRAVWIATVSNLDWPLSRTDTPAKQRADLVSILDRLKAGGTNAVHFQVRTECDALYRSATEPWSQFLTGVQGQDPGWDPLAFAVEQAHLRGMELHAWLNPYRADAAVAGSDDVAPTHVMKEHPEWVLNVPTLPNKRVLDPGIPDVRAYILGVVEEIVRNYDVDGIHFDDYFYPYPEGSFTGMRNEDAATYNTYGQPLGFAQTIYRVYSVNMLVRGVQERINAIRPSVKFGISPFGIWKSGTPAGITGMSGADAIYADAVVWMEQRWLDYLTPQLYWRFGGGQDYAKLAPWWATQMNGRHFYPGLITTTNEIPRMIDFNRANGYGGQTIFRAQTLLASPSAHLGTRYARPALPPLMPWKNDAVPPNPPANVRQTAAGANWDVTWAKPAPAADGDTARYYAIYRHSAVEPMDLSSSKNLVGIVGGGATTFRTVSTGNGDGFVVTALDKLWNESAPAEPVLSDAGATPTLTAFGVDTVYPNPAAGAVTVRYRLDAPGAVTLDLYDLAGRRVARLVEDSAAVPGERQAVWTRRADAGALAPGLYVLRLRQGGRTATAPLTLL